MAPSPEYYQQKEGGSYWGWVGLGIAAIVVLGIAADADFFPDLRNFVTPKLPTIQGG